MPKITIISFGYKYSQRGMLPAGSRVVDVRLLPNPFYDPDLKPLDGRDPRVQAFVRPKLEKIEWAKLLREIELKPEAIKVLAFGCTGGHHRSVACAEMLASILTARKYQVEVRHMAL